MTEYISNSYEKTLLIATDFAKTLSGGTTIAFIGDLGAGKTAFATGFVKGLGIEAEVSSPTFAVCNVYRGDGFCVYHYDMYRINGWDDLYSIGFLEGFGEKDFALIEWSENVFNALDDKTVFVAIEKLGENERRISIMNKNEAEIKLGIID